MAGFSSMIFLLQFLIVIGIMLFKIWYIMDFFIKEKLAKKEVYNIGNSFMLFITFLLFWGIGFITAMVEFEEIILLQLFRFEIAFLPFMALFFMFDIIFYLVTSTRAKTKGKAYKAKEVYTGG